MNPQDTVSQQRDKLGVFILCGMALAILGGISWGAIDGEIPAVNNTLLGVIVGGILIFARECLVVIRQFWADAKTAKLTDALAAAGPPIAPILDDTTAPAAPPLGNLNAVAASQDVADAAQDKADVIAGGKP